MENRLIRKYLYHQLLIMQIMCRNCSADMFDLRVSHSNAGDPI